MATGIVLLLALCAGCGTSAPRTVAGASGSHRAVSGVSTIYGADGRPVDPAAPASKTKPTGEVAPSTLSDFVTVHIPEEISWDGPTCGPPRPGSVCLVTFTGSVQAAGAHDALVIRGFENGTSKQVVRKVLQLSRGFTRVNTQVTYTVGADARYAVFWSELQDQHGATLAKTTPQSFPILQKK